jgi:hypothetical protein
MLAASTQWFDAATPDSHALSLHHPVEVRIGIFATGGLPDFALNRRGDGAEEYTTNHSGHLRYVRLRERAFFAEPRARES